MSFQSTSMMKKQRRRKSLEQSNPDKIINLIMSLTDETSALLQIKINVYLEEECKAYKVFQVIANTERMEAYIDAISGIPLLRKYKIRLSPKLHETLKFNIELNESLSNFDPEIQNFIGTPAQNTDFAKQKVQLIPVKGSSFSVIYCIVKPNIQAEKVAQYVKECALFTWPTLSKSISLEFERTLKLKCQQLLKLAKKLFTQVATLETVLEIAKDQAKQLMKAEYCSVMLVDVDKMELYDTCPQLKAESVERRFPFNIGVTGEVIRTGMLINVRCPKEHHMFTPAIDCVPGITCRNLLCFPIREKTGIIGIGQLINKIDDPYFDAMDEEMALAYSIYCGVCITHSMVYQKIQEAHVRNALANELVMYHMKVTDKEVDQVANCPKRHDHSRLWSLHFNQSELPPSELPCYVLKMFIDLGFDKKFKIKQNKLCRFIVSVRKEYRHVPYHNWMHAFSVAQWSYSALVNYHLVQLGYFNELQALMFLLAGLMHDLDHRGSSASFQLHGQTTLVALYSSEGSVMERHRLSQAMCILNTEGCDILESLPRRDYDLAIMLLRDFILATDLSNFLKSLNDFHAIASNYQKTKSTHKMALQSILMNAADLSDYTKDWNNVKRTAAAVLTEFFKQAEVGKAHAEIPTYMLDSKKNCVIPDLQIEFLQDICMPLFTIVEQILPHAANLVKVIESHIARWEAAKLVFSEIPLTAGLSVLLSPNLDTLIEKSVKEKEEELARLAAEAEEDD